MGGSHGAERKTKNAGRETQSPVKPPKHLRSPSCSQRIFHCSKMPQNRYSGSRPFVWLSNGYVSNNLVKLTQGRNVGSVPWQTVETLNEFVLPDWVTLLRPIIPSQRLPHLFTRPSPYQGDL